MGTPCYAWVFPRRPGGTALLAILSKLLTDHIARDGYLGVLVLMALDSACIPIPSEVTMSFAGALASATFASSVLGDPSARLGLWGVIAAGIAGSLVGSWLAWWAGDVGGRPLIDRFGRYLLLRPHEVDRAHAWFERHGEAAVFFGRMIPVVRTFISLPAGVARMSFWRFTLYTFLGSVPWTVGLALAGYGLGERWDTVDRYLGPASIAVAIVGLGAIALWVRRRLRARAGRGAVRTNGHGG